MNPRANAVVLCLALGLALGYAIPTLANDQCQDSTARDCTVEPAQARDTDATRDSGSTAGELPAQARKEVEALRVMMRFNMARGFQKKSRQQRDEIAAIYAHHEVPLPSEYHNW